MLGSTSHAISLERQRIACMRINPKLKAIVAEKFAHHNNQLFGQGFLERTFKTLEADRALEKVADPGVSRRGTFNKMHVIFVVFIQRRSCKVWRQEGLGPFSAIDHNNSRTPPTSTQGSKQREIQRTLQPQVHSYIHDMEYTCIRITIKEEKVYKFCELNTLTFGLTLLLYNVSSERLAIHT